MRSVQGSPTELFAHALDSHRLAVDTDPTQSTPLVVTLPTAGLTRSLLDAAADDPPVSTALVVARGLVEDLSDGARTRLAEIQAAAAGVRVASVSNPVVATPQWTLTLDTAVSQPVGQVVTDDVYDCYREIWERADPATIEFPPRSSLVETVARRLGDTAAEIVDRELDRTARGTRGLDLASLLLWAGAVEETTAPAVIDLLEETDVVSHQAVERRLSRLETEELLQTLPHHDGTPGRPSRQLSVAVELDDPAEPPDWVLAALT